MEAQIISERFKYSSKNNIKKMNFKQLEFKKEFEIFLFSSVLEKFVCQMCGEDELKIIGEIDRYGFYYPTGICNSCGHIQQKYYYNQKLLDLFYQKYNGVIYRNDINPERHFENSIQKTRIYYEILEKHVYEVKEILDIGCASGGLLFGLSKIFKANGTGVDYPNEFTELAQKKGLEILFGRIEDIDFKKKFDLIVLSHVLEHITNPKALIYSLKKLLSTKGILIIEVPSVDNLLNGKYSFDLLKYFQNMHIHHFTINSLRYLAQELSLEIIYIDDVSRVVMKNKLKKDDLQHFNNFEKSYSLLQSIEELRIKKNKYKIFRAPIVTLKSIIRFIK